MTSAKKILVVDDDPHLRDIVVYALEREGFTVTVAEDGRVALQKLTDPSRFDLVVLDIMMPEIDGLEVCRKLREKARTPVVFLSSRDEELDRIVGLELGGDDYITKPFSPREMVARVRAVLRRAEYVHDEKIVNNTQQKLRLGPIELDTERFEAKCNQESVKLTVTEFGVLETLISSQGRVLSRTQLMERAYRYDNFVTDRTIDTHIKRIRKKFKDYGFDPIETVHGLGYKCRAG